jgi:uncharacterized delta-60 repeat protein
MKPHSWVNAIRKRISGSNRNVMRNRASLRLMSLESRDVPAIAGSLDPTFGSGGRLMSDFTPTDNPNPDFVSSDVAMDVAVQPDGKILVAGISYQAIDWQQIDFALARYLPDGRLDDTFGINGQQLIDFGGNDYCSGLTVLPDGKIVLAGYTEAGSNGTEDLVVAQLNSDGSLDVSFSGDGKQFIDFSGNERLGDHGLSIQPDGKIVVVGFTSPGVTRSDIAVARLNADGSLDSTFNDNGKRTIDLDGDDFASGVAIQTINGTEKLVVCGTTYPSNPDVEYPLPVLAVLRLNVTDGSIDATFASNGLQILDLEGDFEGLTSVAIQSDGKIVLAGTSDDSGTPELTQYSDMTVVRLNADGGLDNSFDGDGQQNVDFFSYYDYATDVALQDDGKIVVIGHSFTEAFGSAVGVFRLNGDGSLDTSFDGDGRQVTSVGNGESGSAVAIQHDGNVVVTGGAYVDSSYLDVNFATVRLVGNEYVASIPNAADGQFVSLQAPEGTSITSASAIVPGQGGIDPLPTSGPLKNASMPVGAFDFTVEGVATDQSVTITIIMPAGVTVNGYYKFGLEPTDNAKTKTLDERITPHWWEFKWDNSTGTGAQFQDVNSDGTNDVVLTFLDNQRGDDNVAAGIIDDPGAPVFLQTIQVEIDIRSSVNLASQGRIAAAIFSTADFDATRVNATTVLFAGASTVAWSLEDVNGDGRLDMVLQFRTQDTNLQAIYEQLLADDINEDGILDSNQQTATIALTGSTTDDELFEGSDTLDLFLTGRNLRELLAELAAAGAI